MTTACSATEQERMQLGQVREEFQRGWPDRYVVTVAGVPVGSYVPLHGGTYAVFRNGVRLGEVSSLRLARTLLVPGLSR